MPAGGGCATTSETSDADRDVKLHVLLRPSSQELVKLFPDQKQRGLILANDTSCGAGYAPFSPLESAIIAVERHLNGTTIKAAHPELGDDIKVMAVRSDGVVRFTVAAAFVGAHVADAQDYLAKKAEIRDAAAAVVSTILAHKVSVELNTADVPPHSLYLTVTGLSAEAGDDGEAGHGDSRQRPDYAISSDDDRNRSPEDPVNHVGKLYNLVAALIADDLVHQVAEIEAVEVYVASQIGPARSRSRRSLTRGCA